MKRYHFNSPLPNIPSGVSFPCLRVHEMDENGDIVPSNTLLELDLLSESDVNTLSRSLHKRSFAVKAPGLAECESSDSNNPEKSIHDSDTLYVINYTKKTWIMNMRMLINMGIISVDYANRIEETEEDRFPMKTKVKVKRVERKDVVS